MRQWTRREVLKSGVAVSAGITSAMPATAARVYNQNTTAAPQADNPSSPRERLLMDFSWRFHLGHATDPAQDFGFDGDGIFSKSGGDFFDPSRANFDDSKWRLIDLPHDWAVELDFEHDPGLVNHGFKPLDRNYPATSIGWYRRVFEIPAGDLGKRLSHRVRRRLPRLHGGAKRPFPGAEHERLRALHLRRDGLPQLRSQEHPGSPRRRNAGRRVVLRGRGNLPPRVAGQNSSCARAAVGNVRDLRGAAGRGTRQHHYGSRERE